MESITLKQIVARLNQLVEDLKGQKVTNFGNFHQEVEERISEYLKSINLRYGVWSVSPLDFRGYLEILKLKIPNFKEDARVKNNRSGTIVDIEFVITLNLSENSTVAECLEELKKQEHLKSIKYTEEEVEELRSKLDEAEERLAKLKKNV